MIANESMQKEKMMRSKSASMHPLQQSQTSPLLRESTGNFLNQAAPTQMVSNFNYNSKSNKENSPSKRSKKYLDAFMQEKKNTEYYNVREKDHNVNVTTESLESFCKPQKGFQEKNNDTLGPESFDDEYQSKTTGAYNTNIRGESPIRHN